MLQKFDSYVYTGFFTFGFMLFDMFSIIYLYHERNKMAYQTIWHHISFITGIGSGMVAGYSLPGIANLAMLAEISSIFLNIKDLIPKEQRNTPFAQFN